jgi:hypothetical protein
MFVLGMLTGSFVGECGAINKIHVPACEMSCARNGAGKRYDSDETWCTCTSGVALKRDRSRLYVAVKGRP